MNTEGQITVRAWLALPAAERAERTRVYREADLALQDNSYAEHKAGIREETDTYLELNGRVNELWPTVAWWVREPALGGGPAITVIFETTARTGFRLARLTRLAVSRRYRAEQATAYRDYLEPGD